MRHTHPFVKLLAPLPLLFLGGCGSESDPAVSQPEVFTAGAGEEIILGYGESVEVNHLALEFTAVAEDSRCPIEASCLAGWVGNARILVTASHGGLVGMLELNTHPDFPGQGQFAGYLVELRKLAPELPSRLGPPEQYEALLSITRLIP
jgi:hypothetical protein